MAACRDGDVNDRARLIWTRLIDEAMSFGRRLVAERRTGASPEQRRPELRIAAGSAGEGRVDTTLDALPPAVLNPVAYREDIKL
jgi:hypothetical protein